MTANDVLQLRRGTAAEWTSADPTLRAGEIGWETDTNKLKIGDGVTAWTSLAYFTGGASGAPDDADYLVGTANGDLSAEIVVGTSPGGELGGTWASPTVDATHSGTSHAGVVSAHEAAGDPHTGYRLESADHTHASSGLQAGQVDHGTLGGLADDDHPQYATNTEFDDHSARHEDGGADEISITGLSGTPAALTTHEADTSTHGAAEVAGIEDITFETLDAAGDVGTGASQLAEGDHTHVGGGSTVEVEEDNAAVGTASTLDFGNGIDVGFAAGEAEITVDLGEVTAFTDHSARHENGGADEISIAGLDGTPTELTNHVGAADPHTGYRLESADHTHQSTGAEAGTLDHGLALTGLTDDDHTIYLKEKASGGVAGEVPTHNHSAAGEAGTIDHGAITGLSDDDHPQYALDTDLTTHAGAADPHTGYRLESADHTHASTGLQAGQLDHGTALTGLSDDDHPQYRLESESGTFTVGAFFDGNGSTLATGVRPIWRAPFDCTVTSVHAYVDTGTTTVVNAGTGAASGEDFCSSNITIDPADAWEAGTVNQNTAVTTGETVSVEIVTAGTATQLTVQIGFTRP